MGNWIEILVGTGLTIGGAVLTQAWHWLKKRTQGRGQRALLNGLGEPLLFVFPGREDVPEAILPRISIEDFMAINNTISSLLMVGCDTKIRVRDAKRLTDKEKQNNNLILFCSSKTNTVTGEALDLLSERYRGQNRGHLVPKFVKNEQDGTTEIEMCEGTYKSPSFAQIRKLREEDDDNDLPARIAKAELDDVAAIVKARSPWSNDHKILILAGLRGFGTWGAGECLKKWWRPIYAKKGRDRKQDIRKEGDFAALIHVKYAGCDIKHAKLLQCVDLDPPPNSPP